jgi:hypothetical protein
MVHVPPVDERDGDAFPARPAGAADPVHVGHLVVRALVVTTWVTSSTSSPRAATGGGEHVHLAAAERAQRPLPLALPQVAVHGGHREAPAGQRGRDLVGGPLGLAEHDGQAAVLACRIRASTSILSIWWARNTCCSVLGTGVYASWPRPMLVGWLGGGRA